MGLAGLLLSVSGARLGVADDAGPKIQYFTAAQLKALVVHPVDGMAFNQFLKDPGSNVYIIRRDKNGDLRFTWLSMTFILSKAATRKSRSAGESPAIAKRHRRNGAAAKSRRNRLPLAPGDVLFIPGRHPAQGVGLAEGIDHLRNGENARNSH